MPTLELQPIVTPADWEWAVAIRNRFMPHDPTTVERARAYYEAHPERVPRDQRLVALDGVPVALIRTVQAYWTPDPTRFDLVLFPEGAESPIREALEAGERLARDLGGETVEIWSPTYCPRLTEALEAAGYQPGQRNPVSMLDLPSFDAEPWDERCRHVFETGLAMVSLAEFEARYPEEWARRYWRTEMDLLVDVPGSRPWVDIPFEDWERDFHAAPLAKEWIFFAVDGDVIAGMSQLHKNWVDTTLMNTGLTGVRREYRRRGIAAALKSRSLAMAKAAGITRVYTDNEENNPMFQLNLDLGFKEVFAFTQFERTL